VVMPVRVLITEDERAAIEHSRDDDIMVAPRYHARRPRCVTMDDGGPEPFTELDDVGSSDGEGGRSQHPTLTLRV
jgi:hypothetical protein